MGPPSYMWSVVDGNVVMRSMSVLPSRPRLIFPKNAERNRRTVATRPLYTLLGVPLRDSTAFPSGYVPMTGTFDKHLSHVGYLDTECLSSVVFVVRTVWVLRCLLYGLFEFCDVCCTDCWSSVVFVVRTVWVLWCLLYRLFEFCDVCCTDCLIDCPSNCSQPPVRCPTGHKLDARFFQEHFGALCPNLSQHISRSHWRFSWCSAVPTDLPFYHYSITLSFEAHVISNNDKRMKLVNNSSEQSPQEAESSWPTQENSLPFYVIQMFIAMLTAVRIILSYFFKIYSNIILPTHKVLKREEIWW